MGPFPRLYSAPPSFDPAADKLAVDFAEPKTITVTNSANAKVTCNWVMPNDWVRVIPESADVLPRGGVVEAGKILGKIL